MATAPHHPTSTGVSEPQPAWDVALLFPNQGDWNESDYFSLETNHFVELVNGNLEVLPMPTISHQMVLIWLFDTLRSLVASQQLGTVLLSPLPMHIRSKTIRESDLMFVGHRNRKYLSGKYLTGADLVMEVVSPDDKSHVRDYQEKRADYAELGVKEYWIIDPQNQRVTVLSLDGSEYRMHGEYVPGQTASSALLDGFEVDVAVTFAAAKSQT